MMTKLSSKQRQQLKAKAHNLNPIIFIGNNGFTDNIKNDIDRGLNDHELIKIRIQAERDVREDLFLEICEAVRAHPVQLIGGIGIIYRKNEI